VFFSFTHQNVIIIIQQQVYRKAMRRGGLLRAWRGDGCDRMCRLRVDDQGVPVLWDDRARAVLTM
jgi:hypothetical protein